MEPVSSSSSTSSSSSSDQEESVKSSSSSSIIEESKNSLAPEFTSFDDLPTDDSGSELESSSSDYDSEENEVDEVDEEHQTLEERLKKRQQDGISPARRRKMKHKDGFKNDDETSKAEKTSLQDKKKSSSKKQHAPTEVSSKRSDYFRRGAPHLANNGIAIEAAGKGFINRFKPRDPRMESLNGHFDQGAFDHNYAFLIEMQKNEIKQLRARIAARKLTGKKGQKQRRKLGLTNSTTSNTTLEEDEQELKRLLQVQANKEKAKSKKEAKTAMKRKMKQEIQSGKRTKEYYFKKKDWKRMELEQQYETLKRKGGTAAIDKILAKKRKKNLGRDGKFIMK